MSKRGRLGFLILMAGFVLAAGSAYAPSSQAEVLAGFDNREMLKFAVDSPKIFTFKQVNFSEGPWNVKFKNGGVEYKPGHRPATVTIIKDGGEPMVISISENGRVFVQGNTIHILNN